MVVSSWLALDGSTVSYLVARFIVANGAGKALAGAAANLPSRGRHPPEQTSRAGGGHPLGLPAGGGRPPFRVGKPRLTLAPGCPAFEQFVRDRAQQQGTPDHGEFHLIGDAAKRAELPQQRQDRRTQEHAG